MSTSPQSTTKVVSGPSPRCDSELFESDDEWDTEELCPCTPWFVKEYLRQCTHDGDAESKDDPAFTSSHNHRKCGRTECTRNVRMRRGPKWPLHVFYKCRVKDERACSLTMYFCSRDCQRETSQWIKDTHGGYIAAYQDEPSNALKHKFIDEHCLQSEACRGCGVHEIRHPRGPSPKLFKCGKCQRVGYCSKECQTSDWQHHNASFCSLFVAALERKSQEVKKVSTLNAIVASIEKLSCTSKEDPDQQRPDRDSNRHTNNDSKDVSVTTALSVPLVKCACLEREQEWLVKAIAEGHCSRLNCQLSVPPFNEPDSTTIKCTLARDSSDKVQHVFPLHFCSFKCSNRRFCAKQCDGEPCPLPKTPAAAYGIQE